MKVVIIGGGSAGTNCAFELRKLDKESEITIIEKSKNLSYSPCALPYVLSKEIGDFSDIFIFKKTDYEESKIDIVLNSSVKKIDRKKKTLSYETEGREKTIPYDKLVISTGSRCFIPPIRGIEKADFLSLKTIDDAKGISERIKKGSKSIIIGAGSIGCELALAVSDNGGKAILIEVKEHILPKILDRDMSERVKMHLKERGISIHENEKIEEVFRNKVKISSEELDFDSLFMCAGIIPETGLAEECGLKTNSGIAVDEYLRTSDKDIYACGDCALSEEFFTGRKIAGGLGTIAVRQAKVIAKNISGKKEKFPGILNNSITKLGDLYVASCGLTEISAKESGIKTVSAKYTGSACSEYYPSDETLSVKIICTDKGEITGAQIIGERDVAGRIDLLALAMQNGIGIRKLSNLETCYNPASAPIFDPVTVAAEIALKKLGLLRGSL